MRPYSDLMVLAPTDGWSPRCHVEDGKVWEIYDAAAWQEVKG
ncbi:hypothetical protein GEOBRER4_n2829 [Citrifermentans bremense]|uniref:Uncharacterized protein n=1 Tax=Citrifermentans bremense TaxID=60035 RepID=A0A7R7FSE8_9BACT|nr:hypothetical protein GEOBRER4_n2829 [Citrifermentans bremense]